MKAHPWNYEKCDESYHAMLSYCDTEYSKKQAAGLFSKANT